MQKVIRRTLLAERQAARRLEKRKDKNAFDRAKSAREQATFVRKDVTGDLKEAKRVRRENYELGPLAPRRDVGTKAETYGTIAQNRLSGPPLTFEQRKRVNPSGYLNANIVVGDRVVILKGRDTGKIGKVEKWDPKAQEVTVENLNLVDIEIPKWMMATDADQRPVRSMPAGISIADVRLVFPLKDPATGAVRDVIVKEIENGNVFHDKYTGSKSYNRKIAGTDIKIPFPKKAPREHKDQPNDTLRLDVEARTFVPSLLKPPMPGSVIDELRNKFSKFRTRHDEWYIASKEAEDKERIAREQSVKKMRTPLKELNRQIRKAKKRKGKPELSPELLARIGAVIERKKSVGKQLGAAKRHIAAGLVESSAEPEKIEA